MKAQTSHGAFFNLNGSCKEWCENVVAALRIVLQIHPTRRWLVGKAHGEHPRAEMGDLSSHGAFKRLNTSKRSREPATSVVFVDMHQSFTTDAPTKNLHSVQRVACLPKKTPRKWREWG